MIAALDTDDADMIQVKINPEYIIINLACLLSTTPGNEDLKEDGKAKIPEPKKRASGGEGVRPVR